MSEAHLLDVLDLRLGEPLIGLGLHVAVRAMEASLVGLSRLTVILRVEPLELALASWAGSPNEAVAV